MQNLGATVTAASVQGQKGSHGSHPEHGLHLYSRLGSGWWPASVSALPHVKPHVGI